MTSVAKADSKNRLRIRGIRSGQLYLIRQAAGGWFVMPEPQERPRPGGMSGKEFGAWWRNRPKLGAETAREILRNIHATKEASRARFD
jgi:hypothetical protein